MIVRENGSMLCFVFPKMYFTLAALPQLHVHRLRIFMLFYQDQMFQSIDRGRIYPVLHVICILSDSGTDSRKYWLTLHRACVS